MRKIKEILRLKLELGLKNREIARSCSIPHSSVGNCLMRARAAGLTWPLAPDLDDSALEALLYPTVSRCRTIPLPDFAAMHQELLCHRHLTLELLWQEYKQAYPDGYQYSRFCELYALWARKLDFVLRQDHRAGEKMFVDHAGPTVPVVSSESGEIREASIFVAVLGASSYTFCEAVWKRDLYSWIGSHTRAVEFFRGVTTVTVPDNWKTAVKHACYYEPDLNPTYLEWAEHYGTVIIPARVRKPKDKAKVEGAVLLVERWILAALRKRTFFSLAELNKAIHELLVKLNQRKFKKLNTTRAKLFEETDRLALRPLPATPFEFAEWKKAKVHPDYHVEVERHYYSVPYQHVHADVEVRYTEKTVEVLRKGKRIAIHARSYTPGDHTTLEEHRPEKHQHLEWTFDRMVAKGKEVGPYTESVLKRIMNSKKHPELGYRGCMGVLRMAKTYSRERLEAACRRALAMNACSYHSIKSILKTSLDRQPLEPVAVPAIHSAVHDNVRGPDYYRNREEVMA